MSSHNSFQKTVTVSIITPVFGRANLLRKTAESVIAQDYPYWEWVMIDDGSPEREFKEIEEISRLDPRIKLQRRTLAPKGANTCRNLGFNISRGDWVIFLDSDDILQPFCVSQRMAKVRELTTPTSHSAIAAPTIERMMNGTDRTNVLFSGASAPPPIIQLLFWKFPWQTASVLWPREAVERSGKWRERMPRYQDWDFHIRILLDMENIIWCQDPDSIFVEHRDVRISQRNPVYAGNWLAPICKDLVKTTLKKSPKNSDIRMALNDMIVRCIFLIGLDRNWQHGFQQIRRFKKMKELSLPGTIELYVLLGAAGVPRIRHIVPKFFAFCHRGRSYQAFKKLPQS